jgi:hypothetical protein
MKKSVEQSEMGRAFDMMTPSQLAGTEARDAVFKSRPYFEETGVKISDKQTQLAAHFAGDRAILDFEKTRREDPLYKIEAALTATAHTTHDKTIAERQVVVLDKFRATWKNFLIRKEGDAHRKGISFNPEQAVVEAIENGSEPTRVQTVHQYSEYTKPENQRRYYALTDLFYGASGNEEVPSEVYRLGFLREMGALKPDQTVESLRDLPERPLYLGMPYFNKSMEYADHIKTRTDGIDLGVDFRYATIGVAVEIPVLIEIANSSKK